jgi:class 3 adenylate cyclase/tetratricopeptide (TPR) repeat protein
MLRRLDLRRNVQDKSVSTKPDDESSRPGTMGGEPGSAWGDETSAQYQALVSYMPHFRRAAFDPRTKRSFPSAVSASAAVLRSDIVGFTLLTDRMVKSSIGGAEQLADVMNRVVNRMAEIAWALGGELANLAGDAATFIWFARAGLSLDEATILGIQTAVAIHREAKTWLVDGAALQFRSTIGCGTLYHFEVGGKDDEWHGVIVGPALSDVIAAGRLAAPGQTVISRSAVARVGRRCECSSLGEGVALVNGIVDLASPPDAPPPSGNVPWSILRKVVPRVLLGGDHAQSLTLGEFRTVTAIYTLLSPPEYASPEDALATLQAVAQRVQSCLSQFEGQIYQIHGDDDGITIISVFGLPPWSHEDDAARAVRAVLALHREWGNLGLTSSTGIATGRIFCGILRTTNCGVLALIGPVMNLAARLMQLNAGVVCDAETKQAGRQPGRISARTLTPRRIKGKPHPITAFVPYEVGDGIWQTRSFEEATVIGRELELAVLTDSLAKARAGICKVAVIEGEAGIGKTTLVNRITTIANDAGMVVLAGAADSTDHMTAYFAWRRVFLDLLGRSDLTVRAAGAPSPLPASAADRSQGRITKMALSLGAFAHLAPLLEDMLGLEFADNRETVLLRGQARADALAHLLLELLREAAGDAPIVVVMEDMHWLDPSSLSFFARLGEAQLPLMLVGTTREVDVSAGLRTRLAQVEGSSWLRLEPLSVAETGQLLARTLGSNLADGDLAVMFHDRTGGNPLFVEELSRMALANRLVVVDSGVRAATTFAATNDELDDLLRRQGLPSTIEGVIRGRLDVLRNAELSVLRAASVVGQNFNQELCSVGLPTLGPAEVARSLAVLTELAVIQPFDDAPNEYSFGHAVLRDVVYNTMSFAERRQIHDFVGSWIEQHPLEEDVSALLGYHFLQANRTVKAMRYFIAAGEAAIRGFANAEAAAILMRAFELDRTCQDTASVDGLSKPERAHLLLLLGRAFLGLSRYADCRTHNESGLRLAGFLVAASSLGVVLGLLAQTTKQVRYRFWPSKSEAPAPETAILREAVLAFEALAETYFYLGDGPRTLYAAMSTLNLSERLGPSPELARGCATLSGIAGLFRLRKLSGHYSGRALEVLTRLNDPAAEIWVSILLGLSKLGEGEWEEARMFFAKVVAAAVKVGDRRRWRDGVENAAIIEACRGRWKEALDGLSAMFASADKDKDQRYMVLVYRERAYCYLQLGDLHAVDDYLKLIEEELARGLTAEQLPTRHDMHAVAATLALERGDHVSAATESAAAIKAIVQIDGTSSVPSMYLTIFLVARVFANLWLEATSKNAADRRLLRGMAEACRALSTQAWSHPIAAPSAAIARGYLASFRSRPTTALRYWRRAAAEANRLGMGYESRLASVALGADSGRTGEVSGLPFIIVNGGTDAG